MEDPVIAAATIIQARLPAAVEALYPTPSPVDDGVDATMNEADTGAATDNPEQARIYHIPNDHSRPYWARSLRTERFSDSDRGLLYRPVITRTLLNDIESCFDRPFKPGIMVKGPQGIGKSHTLVNLCMLLQSCPKYHVTFFPDCNDWESIDDFVEVVFASFGITLDLADQIQIANAMTTAARTLRLLGIVYQMLQKRNIKWIFIFDQVNAIFGRPDYNQIKDVHKLPFPYNLMGRLMTPKRIMSIICASANNEISHREGHEGFRDFHHKIRLEVDEATILFPHFPQREMAKALEETGAIPLQMYRLIVEAESNEDIYMRAQFDSIVNSAVKLMEQLQDGHYSDFLAGIIQTLLKSPTTTPIFDRKYFVDNPVGRKHCYEPLFPLVEEVYMEKFWDDVMAHIEKHEEELLQVCKNPDVDQGSRGRHFELIVIRRCMKGQFDVPVNDDESVQQATIPSNAKRFSGKTLPGSSKFVGLGGVMVPTDPNFPAVDILWYMGTTRLIGVQVHVSDHENTVNSFEGLCRGAKLDDYFDSIEMWYLSPTTVTADKVRGFCGKHDCRTTRSLSKEWSIDVKARTLNDISCLQDLPWSHPSNRG